MLRNYKLVILASVAAVMLPTKLLALVEGEVLVGYSLGYDDNIGQQTKEQGPIEDIENELYLEVDLSKRTGFFRYDIFGQTDYIAHSSDVVSDQFTVDGGINALWLISPNRFAWELSDVAEIRRRDVASLASSGNTEQTNVLRTGPTVYFRPFTRTTLDLGAFYQQSWYEFGDSNEYVGVSANSTYRYSTLTTFSGFLSEIHFLPDGSDYSDQVNRNIGWQMYRRLQRGAWYIGAGTSQVVVDGALPNDDAEEWIPTYTAGLSYRLTSSWRFGLDAERRVITIGEDSLNAPDRGSLLTRIETEAVEEPAAAPQLGALRDEVDEFRYSSGFNVTDAGSASLRWSNAQWGAILRAFTRRVEIPEFQIDLSQEARALLFPTGTINAGQDVTGVSFLMTLEPKPRWLVDFGITLENRDIRTLDISVPDPDQDDIETREIRETRIGSNVTYAASRFLSFGGRIDTVSLKDRNSITGDVRSNRITFNVEYSL